MTLLGKAFVGIITLLSLVFLGLAIAVTATHRNWRDMVLNPNNGLKAQVEEQERMVGQLQESLRRAQQQLAMEQAARRTALAALQTRVDQYQQQLLSSEKQVEDLQGQLTELAAADNARMQELERLSLDNNNLRTQIVNERDERDNLFVRATELTDRLNKYRGTLDNLMERRDQLVAQVTRYQEIIDRLGINPADPLDGAPPQVNGQVVLVNLPANAVELSIGYDEGLRNGHTLEVTREGRYVGRVRVTKTSPDRSVAEILNDYRMGIIQRGDRVDTSID